MIELNNQCQSTQKIARKHMSSVLHPSQDFLWIVETLNMEIRLEHLYTIRQHFVKFQNPTPANLYKKNSSCRFWDCTKCTITLVCAGFEPSVGFYIILLYALAIHNSWRDGSPWCSTWWCGQGTSYCECEDDTVIIVIIVIIVIRDRVSRLSRQTILLNDLDNNDPHGGDDHLNDDGSIPTRS